MLNDNTYKAIVKAFNNIKNSDKKINNFPTIIDFILNLENHEQLSCLKDFSEETKIDYEILLKAYNTEILNKKGISETKQKEIDNLHRFYRIKKKRASNGTVSFEGIVIDNVEFVEMLKSFGFYRYDIGAKQSKFVKITDNQIEDVSEEQIIDFVENYVKNLPQRVINDPDIGEITIQNSLIIKKLYDSLDLLFKKRILGRLNPDKKICLLEDTKTEKYFFFQNCYVKVSETEVIQGDYSDITKYIWKDNILERDYTKGDGEKGVFEKFCQRLAGEVLTEEAEYKNFNQQAYTERLQSLKTYIGYLLHSYYKGKLRAICFTDSSSEETESNGRTGKTMLTRAIVKMLQHKKDDKEEKAAAVYAEISGKSFDVRDVHKYSKVKLDTKIIHINDLPRFFGIEPLFNDISDGCEAKELYANKFSVMAKFVLSTNYMIKIAGESSKDRIRFFEVANHYNASFSPDMEFNQWFFDDWTGENAIEWLRFNDFCISCLQDYFKLGMIEAKSINLNEKELREFTSKEFYNWMEEQLSENDSDGNYKSIDERIIINKADDLEIQKYDKKLLFGEYKKEFYDGMNKKQQADFTQKKLIGWIKFYFKKKFPTVEILEKHSGGVYWIWFVEKENN